MAWILNGIWNLETHPSEIQTNGPHFAQKPFEIPRQECPDFEWSGFQMVETIAIAIAKARPCDNLTI